MRDNSLEAHLIRHCSPTLAGIKTGSLFRYKFISGEAFAEELSEVNEVLNPKGVFVEILQKHENNMLIYVYRFSKLYDDLWKSGVTEFLCTIGYTGRHLKDHIDCLKSRFAQNGDFPHEIGLFLGYPLPDVVGFIENEGQNSKHTGCWKVYCNESEAVRLFAQFRKCAEVYMRIFLQGKPVERMVVVA